MRATALHRYLSELSHAPDSSVNLGEAMLMLSTYAHPELDVEAAQAQLDALAERLEGRLAGHDDPLERVRYLTRFLSESCGFRGNHAAYYDPSNSYLHLVMARRVGIPISLSVLYIEVARRAGLALDGVGFPFHFLVKPRELRDVFIDPFDGGRLMSGAECQALLHAMSGGQVPFQPAYLRPVRPVELLQRVLRNLKHAHLRRDQIAHAITCIDLLLALEPSRASELRDRGWLHMNQRSWRRALDDLGAYLDLVPETPERIRIEATMTYMRQQLWSVQ